MNKETGKVEIDKEQLLYADILGRGMKIGLLILILTFFLYASGIIAPAVPLDALSGYWHMDVHHFLEAVEADYLKLGRPATGWSWVALLGKGDYLNFVPIVILSSITIFCYLAIIPTLLRKGDRIYAIIAILEALILSLAASGVLTAGH